MAGKLPSKKDKGRCSRCEMSGMVDFYGDGKFHRICGYYNNFCSSVAWNCIAPPEGYKQKANAI